MFAVLNARILQSTNGSPLEAVLLPTFKRARGNVWRCFGSSQVGGGDGQCCRHVVGLWKLLNTPQCTERPCHRWVRPQCQWWPGGETTRDDTVNATVLFGASSVRVVAAKKNYIASSVVLRRPCALWGYR